MASHVFPLLRQDTTPPSSDDNSSSSPLPIIISLSVVIAIIFCFFVFVLIRVIFHRRLLRLPNSSPFPHQHPAAIPQQNPPQSPARVRLQRLAQTSGLSASELSLVAPVIPFERQQEEETTCPICLDDIQPNTKSRRLPCNHPFDTKCIEEWASKANRCPVCNAPIIPDENLQKSRLNSLEGLDHQAPSTTVFRQRRLRTRGENGAFQLRQFSPNTNPEILTSQHSQHSNPTP